MKELSIEEKAQRYDEALERTRKWYDSNTNEGFRRIFEDIFYELKESEDERIRKEIIGFLRNIPNSNYTCEEMALWLEKQGGHAKFINGIQVGDKVTRNKDGVLVNLSQLNRVAKKDEKQGKQKPTDKIEPKFKVGDTITDETGVWPNKKIEAIENENYVVRCLYTNNKQYIPINTQDDYIIVEQKPAWSEEDEEMVQVAINACNLYQDSLVRNDSRFDKAVKAEEWLKSLRPQSHWRPSDEQVEALQTAIGIVGELTPTASLLKEIREQLKKLKG